MRRRRFALVLVVVAAATGINSSRAGDPPPVPQPTSHHKLLGKDVGTWDASIKSWMSGPSSEPMVSKGVETNTMLGGLWLVSEFKGEFGGQPFEGRGQFGYDPNKAKYVGTWIDTMSTEIMQMEGDLDEKTHTLTMTGKGKDQAGKPYEAKEVSEHKGDDTRVFTMFMKSAETKDEYVKVMEITYNRRSK
jgi:hypothetical protein